MQRPRGRNDLGIVQGQKENRGGDSSREKEHTWKERTPGYEGVRSGRALSTWKELGFTLR